MHTLQPTIQYFTDASTASAEVVCFAAGDSRYLSLFAKPLFNSLAMNAGRPFILHLHAINPDVACLALLKNVADMSGGRVAISTEATDLAPLSEKQRKVYYSVARFLVLPDLLRLYQTPVLMVDLDQMVVADIGAAMPDADVALIRFDSAVCNILSLFSASVIFANATIASSEFFLSLRSYLLERMQHDEALTWHLDQAALAVTYLRGPTAARFAFYPPGIMYSSGGSSAPSALPPETVFWSITFSIDQNAVNLEHAMFESYAR